MMPGEGTAEKLPSDVTSPFAYDPFDDELLPWENQKSDVEEDEKLSQYSSCGGESEFERYCSANSVMGTPSVCSSVYEFPDPEFGSFKSFKLGAENRSLNNLVVGGKFSGESDFNHKGIASDGLNLYGRSENFLQNDEGGFVHNNGKIEGWNENHQIGTMGNQNSQGVKVGGSNGYLDSVGISSDLFESPGNGVCSDAVRSGIKEVFESHRDFQFMDDGLEGLDSLSELEYHGGGVGRCSYEADTVSGHDHSDSEESMFGCGSECGRITNSYYVKDVDSVRAEKHSKHENKLLMTSAVAFGPDDWDDFIQDREAGRSIGTLMLRRKFQDEKPECSDNKLGHLNSISTVNDERPGSTFKGQQDLLVDIPRTKNRAHDDCGPIKSTCSSSERCNLLEVNERNQDRCVTGMFVKDNPVGNNESAAHCESTYYVEDKMEPSPLVEGTPSENGLGKCRIKVEERRQPTSIEIVRHCESMERLKMNLPFYNLLDSAVDQVCPASLEIVDQRQTTGVKENDSYLQRLLADSNNNRVIEDSPLIFTHFEDHFSPMKRETSECVGFYDEMVHEMEEILLDADKSPSSRFDQDNSMYQNPIPVPSRDGGSTASSSATNDAWPLSIDGLEVVGARQRTGDVSFSERLVGVKEFTVYRIRIWNGEDSWEVERRYRDFFTLYRQLKKLFADHGWTLPPPWSSVERESRNIFGNASPNVISQRSILIQDCLRSLIQSKFPPSFKALLYFLSPSKPIPSSPSASSPLARAVVKLPFSANGTSIDNFSSMGKTISLVVQVRPYKSMKQLLDAQYHTCAGCHRNFHDRNTRMNELVQALGWGKPRLCEYCGQLFCSTCHTNDTAILPARVLHLWDFTQYPVSQLAKSYLDSIYDKPMLCVSAVNPFLFSKVPALQHVTNIRKKIGAMISYVRCPYRRSIYKGLGSRRYLLESNDFFALRDLIDLSKGVFAALPVMIETLSSKIQEHITERCLVCCDAGIPCYARQACTDPSSLIFPFQEGDVEKCRSCNSVFHGHCFGKVVTCTCGALLNPEEAKRGIIRSGHNIGRLNEADSSPNSLHTDTDVSSRFLSGLFAKLVPKRHPEHQEHGSKDGGPVILMGSFPTNAL